jgi:sugar/nucleoside kinase (ribokinase family)
MSHAHPENWKPMEPRPHFQVLVPGNYFCDLIFTGLPCFPALGTEIYSAALDVVPGGALNTVLALRRLGVHVGWAGEVGDDFFSHYILHRSEDEGVDTSLLARRHGPLQRVTVSLSYPNDRAFITHIDPSPGTTDLLLAALEQATCDHIHFAGLVVDARLPDVLRACRSKGVTISMDCQHRDQTLELPLVCETLSLVDYFMPNATEALRLTQKSDLHAAIAALRERCACVVVKNGQSGAFAWEAGRLCHEPALPVEAVVDTTGAGDVFNAGFLAARLQGLDIQTCLRWGNYCGAMSIQGVGGTSTAPTREQVVAWLAGSA